MANRLKVGGVFKQGGTTFSITAIRKTKKGNKRTYYGKSSTGTKGKTTR